jgi:exopolysaccharide biosynthesis polyprenyl glycosylphosphotransferase
VPAGELTAPVHAGAAAARDRSRVRRAQRRSVRSLARRIAPLLLAYDVIAVVLAYGLAFGVRATTRVPLTSAPLPAATRPPPATLLLLVVSQASLLYVLGLYDARLLRERAGSVFGAVAAVAAQVLLVTTWSFFRGEVDVPRSVLVLYAASDGALIVLSRAAARRLLRGPGAALRVVLVGPPTEVAEVHAQVAPDALRQGIALVGALRPAGVLPATAGTQPPRWLGTTRDLARIVRQHDVEQLIVVPGETGRDELLEAVLRASEQVERLRVALVPSIYELRVGRLASLRIDDVPLIEVACDPSDTVGFRVKALLDHALAALLLLLALPLWLAAAVAIRATSPGPVLFRQRRVGRGGREFLVYKLRTMRDDAERTTGPVLACNGDRRVTGAGRLLRATRIDELPQLLNVLNGTMSLIGPRPERPEFAERLARDIPGYRERWLVKPGLSGLAQVRGEYHTTPACKLKYDLAYIHNHGLLLDLRILVETVKTLATRRGV